MPSSYELIEVLQSQYNLNITQDKDLVVDLKDVLGYFFNLTEYSVDVPGLNVTALFPGQNLPDISQFNFTSKDINSIYNHPNFKSFMSGNPFRVGIETLFESEYVRNYTQFEVPIDSFIDYMLSAELLPRYMAHNFTVIDTFDQSRGKFGSALGNVALIDCRYANRLVESTYRRIMEKIANDQAYYFVFINMVDQ
jgi:hypothetical protein